MARLLWGPQLFQFQRHFGLHTGMHLSVNKRFGNVACNLVSCVMIALELRYIPENIGNDLIWVCDMQRYWVYSFRLSMELVRNQWPRKAWKFCATPYWLSRRKQKPLLPLTPHWRLQNVSEPLYFENIIFWSMCLCNLRPFTFEACVYVIWDHYYPLFFRACVYVIWGLFFVGSWFFFVFLGNQRYVCPAPTFFGVESLLPEKVGAVLSTWDDIALEWETGLHV